MFGHAVFPQEKMGLLLEAVKNQDEDLAHQFKKTEEWATVEEMMSAHGEALKFTHSGMLFKTSL